MEHIVIGLDPRRRHRSHHYDPGPRGCWRCCWRTEIAGGRVELRDIDGLTIENRTRSGQGRSPTDVLEAIKGCDVLLKGPTDDPQGRHAGKRQRGHAPGAGSLTPMCGRCPSRKPGIDWTFFRENTEGEYVLGSRGIEIPDMLSDGFQGHDRRRHPPHRQSRL